MRNNNTHTQWTLAGVIIVIRPRRPTHAGHLKFMEKNPSYRSKPQTQSGKGKTFQIRPKNVFFSLFRLSTTAESAAFVIIGSEAILSGPILLSRVRFCSLARLLKLSING